MEPFLYASPIDDPDVLDPVEVVDGSRQYGQSLGTSRRRDVHVVEIVQPSPVGLQVRDDIRRPESD